MDDNEIKAAAANNERKAQRMGRNGQVGIWGGEECMGRNGWTNAISLESESCVGQEGHHAPMSTALERP